VTASTAEVLKNRLLYDRDIDDGKAWTDYKPEKGAK
jgi:hypothetical protein